jgi:hypothetical protein
MLRSIPLATHTAYQDLLEAHRIRAVQDVGGTPFRRTLKQKSYWYARQRIGERVVDRYLGPDTPELTASLERAGQEPETRKLFDRRCTQLVAQLRAAGLPGVDRDSGKVLSAMERVGVFRLGGTLVGTHAFRLYFAELGVLLAEQAAATVDLDIAAFENLKLAIDDRVGPDLSAAFAGLELAPAPSLDPRHPTRWAMRGGGAQVDFLAPMMDEKSPTAHLQPLGVHAQTLPFLNYLIAEPIHAVVLYRGGVLVQAPRPERYAIHKLIVAQRRGPDAAIKAAKDLAQARDLIEVLLQDRPGLLDQALEDARARGPGWRAAITASLKQRPAIASLLSQLG